MDVLIPYHRKSSKEDPRISRERQSLATSSWANARGVRLAPEIWEPGVSGSKHWSERGIGKALKMIAAGEATGIIVEEQSRLSRENGLATAEMWDAFQAAGIRLVCINDGLDTANGDQELNFGLRALMAREQWKQYARRVEDAKRNAVARGIHISGTVPFGYERDPKTKRLVVRKGEDKIVRQLFKRRAKGESYGSLARWLNEVVPGGASEKGLWLRPTVARMLTNRVYLGEARQSTRHTKQGAHEALVDERTFTVVKALAAKTEPAIRHEGESLLAGIVRCGCCGYSLTRGRSNKTYWVYRHRNAANQALPCEAPATAMCEALDAHVTEALFARALDGVGFETHESTAEVDTLTAKLDELRRERSTYQEREFVKVFGAEAAAKNIAQINVEIDKVEAELAELTRGRIELPDFAAAREKWPTLSVEERHEILSSVITDVLVTRSPHAPIASRVEIVFVDEAPSVARPTRGSRSSRNGTKVDAGVLAA